MPMQPLDPQLDRSVRHNWIPFIFIISVILVIAFGVTIWIYLSPEVVIPYALLTGIGLILSLFQIGGLFSAHKSKIPTESTIIFQIPQAQVASLQLPPTDTIADTHVSLSDNMSLPQSTAQSQSKSQSELQQ